MVNGCWRWLLVSHARRQWGRRIHFLQKNRFGLASAPPAFPCSLCDGRFKSCRSVGTHKFRAHGVKNPFLCFAIVGLSTASDGSDGLIVIEIRLGIVDIGAVALGPRCRDMLAILEKESLSQQSDVPRIGFITDAMFGQYAQCE